MLAKPIAIFGTRLRQDKLRRPQKEEPMLFHAFFYSHGALAGGGWWGNDTRVLETLLDERHRVLRVALAAKGLTNREIARKLGLARSTVNNAIVGIGRSFRTRLKIESVVGVAVWSTLHEFRKRQKLIAWLGICPYTSNLPVVRAAARAKGLDFLPRTRAEVIALIERAFDRNNFPAPSGPPPATTGLKKPMRSATTQILNPAPSGTNPER